MISLFIFCDTFVETALVNAPGSFTAAVMQCLIYEDLVFNNVSSYIIIHLPGLASSLQLHTLFSAITASLPA